ncbi:MAG: hypothetical protein OHK0046_47640 [Anaerolineae bacterium]
MDIFDFQEALARLKAIKEQEEANAETIQALKDARKLLDEAIKAAEGGAKALRDEIAAEAVAYYAQHQCTPDRRITVRKKKRVIYSDTIRQHILAHNLLEYLSVDTKKVDEALLAGRDLAGFTEFEVMDEPVMVVKT